MTEIVKNGTSSVYSLYDAHGLATLSRDGNGGFSLNDRRSFDAWGVVRSEQHGNDPRLRYCASLGHKQDDESGLVYMRARYYEPGTGRFVSEDSARDGWNWFSYCRDDPVGMSDRTGKWPADSDVAQALAITFALASFGAAVAARGAILQGDVADGVGLYALSAAAAIA